MKEEIADRKALGGEYGCKQRHLNYSIPIAETLFSLLPHAAVSVSRTASRERSLSCFVWPVVWAKASTNWLFVIVSTVAGRVFAYKRFKNRTRNFGAFQLSDNGTSEGVVLPQSRLKYQVRGRQNWPYPRNRATKIVQPPRVAFRVVIATKFWLTFFFTTPR